MEMIISIQSELFLLIYVFIWGIKANYFNWIKRCLAKNINNNQKHPHKVANPALSGISTSSHIVAKKIHFPAEDN